MAGAAVFRATRTEAMNTNTKLATWLAVATLGAGTGYVLVTPKSASDLPPLPVGMKAEAVTVLPVPQPEIVVTNLVRLACSNDSFVYIPERKCRASLYIGIVGSWNMNGPWTFETEQSTWNGAIDDVNGSWKSELRFEFPSTNRFFKSYAR